MACRTKTTIPLIGVLYINCQNSYCPIMTFMCICHRISRYCVICFHHISFLILLNFNLLILKLLFSYLLSISSILLFTITFCMLCTLNVQLHVRNRRSTIRAYTIQPLQNAKTIPLFFILHYFVHRSSYFGCGICNFECLVNSEILSIMCLQQQIGQPDIL